MRPNRALKVACLVAALVILPIQSAKACSCAPGDPRDAFARSAGAFVGTFVESHLAEPPDPSGGFSSGDDTIYTFTLDEAYKGALGNPGDPVEVHAAFSGASCGLEVQQGQQYGLFLRIREGDGVWLSSLCEQTTPRGMREAASPLPEPTGTPPLRLVVGGSFGTAQVMGLDQDFRTVDYGFGGTDVYEMDVCPGSKRLLEIGQTYPQAPHLFVRDLVTFETLREIELPYGQGNQYPRQRPEGLDCRSESGRRAVVFSTSYAEPESKSLLLEVDGRDVVPLHEGTGRSATFAQRAAYLASGRWGRDLIRVDLSSGRSRGVARLPAKYLSALALSPDGNRLAGVASPDYRRIESDPTVFFTVNLRRGKVRTQAMGTGERYGTAGWMSSRAPVMFESYPGRSSVFNLRLQTQDRFGRWNAGEAVVVGRTAYGASFGSLYKVRLPDGEVRRVRGLPSPVNNALVAIP